MRSFHSVLALVSHATGAAVLREGRRLHAGADGPLYVCAADEIARAGDDVRRRGREGRKEGTLHPWTAGADRGAEGECLVLIGRSAPNTTDRPAGEPLRAVLRATPHSVFVTASDTTPDTVNRILVLVDCTAAAARSIRYARDLAAVYDARVLLLHVVDENPYVALNRRDRLSLSPTALAEHRARRRLQKWMGRQTVDVHDVDVRIQLGTPARQLRRIGAREGGTLLVLPVAGNQAAGAGPIDADTARMIEYTDGSVLLVRAGDEEGDAPATSP